MFHLMEAEKSIEITSNSIKLIRSIIRILRIGKELLLFRIFIELRLITVLPIVLWLLSMGMIRLLEGMYSRHLIGLINYINQESYTLIFIISSNQKLLKWALQHNILSKKKAITNIDKQKWNLTISHPSEINYYIKWIQRLFKIKMDNFFE